MISSDLFDLTFKAKDRPDVLAQKLEAFRRAAISATLASPTTGKALVQVTNHGRDRGILTPEAIPAATNGEFITVEGENDVFEVCDGADLVTIGWIPVSTDLRFRGEWRTRLTKEPQSGTAKAFTSLAIYDQDGRYLGDLGEVEQEAEWTVADGWKVYRSEASGVDIRAAYPASAYVRAALRRQGDSCAVTQVSRATISTYLLIEGDGGDAQEWAEAAEAFANAADTSRSAAETAAANALAAQLLAQQAVTSAQTAEAAAIAQALAAASSASVGAGHAATAEAQADIATGAASSATAQANVAQGYSEDAQSYALASQSSAESAAISVTNAASSASAAQIARLAAESARGDADQSASAAFTSEQTAGTYAGQAGVYAGAADASRIAAQVAQGDAESAASVATSQAATASAQAAIATQAVTLSASISGGGFMKDPTFADFPTTPGIPTHWQIDTVMPGASSTRFTGLVGGNSWLVISAAGQPAYSAQQQMVPLTADGWYVVEADVRLGDGTFAGAGLLFQTLTSGMVVTEEFPVPFSTTPDETGAVAGSGAYNRAYRFRKLVQLSANAAGFRLYAMAHYSVLGSIAVYNAIVFDRLNLRAATQSEIAGQTVLPGLATTSASHTASIAAIASENAAQASSLTSLTARMGTAESDITTEQTARVAGDAANATSIANVTTSLNGLTATVSTQATSINGLNARYGVTLDVNGYATGFQQNNSGVTSDFTIRADKFGIVAPGGGARTEYSNGNWRTYDGAGTLRTRMGTWT